jgi:TorA maturation chaperone TorD
MLFPGANERLATLFVWLRHCPLSVAEVASNDVTPRVNQVSQGLQRLFHSINNQPTPPYLSVRSPPTPLLSDPIISSVQFAVRALLKRTRRSKVKPYKASFSGVE